MGNKGERRGKAAKKGVRWEISKGKAKKTWCNGSIWIDENGCLYIDDEDLAAELARLKKKLGSICVSYPEEGGDGHKMNNQCNC